MTSQDISAYLLHTVVKVAEGRVAKTRFRVLYRRYLFDIAQYGFQCLQDLIDILVYSSISGSF